MKILSNIRRMMKSSGRVMLVEAVITSGTEPDFGKLLDIEMLVSRPAARNGPPLSTRNCLREPGCV